MDSVSLERIWNVRIVENSMMFVMIVSPHWF